MLGMFFFMIVFWLVGYYFFSRGKKVMKAKKVRTSSGTMWTHAFTPIETTGDVNKILGIVLQIVGGCILLVTSLLLIFIILMFLF